MDIDGSNSTLAQDYEDEKKEKGKILVVMLVGAPGSGKSTFCENVMSASSRPWIRVCQDIINNGKSGNKAQCLSSAAVGLKDRKNVFIDRCNLDKEQRVEFVKLGNPEVDMHAVVLDLPAQLCISRSVKRSGHEGKLQGGKAAAVVNRMLQKKELPKLSEGFSRITFCHTESEVQQAVTMYSGLGPLDTLPPGCFGEKKPDAKVQLGIMKFLEKVDPPANLGSCSSGTQSSLSNQSIKVHQSCSVEPKSNSSGDMGNGRKDGEGMEVETVPDTTTRTNSSDKTVYLDIPLTLAFPSISTADFQFDLEKASDIIVEKVHEYLSKIGTARLVLVDLSHKSKILSLVKAKAAKRSIDSNRFLTFVGNMTCLYSKGGLRCNAIANAANWRLRPGGGGVNAAIFNAAGPSLEIATKERAKSISPGKAVVVPLPSDSPLFSREGVTHVIHVLGPNMNPQRPNYLNKNYEEGCNILREAYSSLFEGFASIIKTQLMEDKQNVGEVTTMKPKPVNHSSGRQGENNACDQKTKREVVHAEERSKKYKGLKYEVGSDDKKGLSNEEDQHKPRSKSGASKAGASWAQALYKVAMDPENYKDVLEITPDIVVLNDIYPKAKRHLLLLARLDGLDRLADVHKEHLQLLKTMQKVGMKWVDKFLQDDDSLVFRLGFHSVPSMRQLHLHVISQDFNSVHLKHKKHWNSFNTEFFRDIVDVIEGLEKYDKISIKDESLLLKELRCHRCKSAHPNIPRLKSHISTCQASFSTALLENGSIVQAPTKAADS